MRSDALLSLRRAAAVYNVPETTLRRQRAKPASDYNTHHNALKLQRHEEETIIQSIRKLEARGFAPTISYVREMANQLLAVRGGG
jgi:replication initiation and membrane attachment protein DnaB